MKRITVTDKDQNVQIYYKADIDADLFVELNFTGELVKMTEMTLEQITAKQYLDATDWYACRKIDVGIPIPEGIKNAREAMRQLL